MTRWITVGVGGVKLDALKMGSKWLTSAEALQRFAEALTAPASSPTPTPPQSPSARRRSVEQADRELTRAGF